MDDVDLVGEPLTTGDDLSFEDLQRRTRLSEGRLSDALARAYEVGIVRINLLRARVGYLRETERRK